MKKTFPYRERELIDYGPKPSGHEGRWLRYRIDAFIHDGPGGRIRKKFETRREADAKLAELRTAKQSGDGLNLGEGDRTTVAVLWERFAESPKVRRTSHRNQSDLREVYNNMVRPRWAMTRLTNISYSAIDSWALELGDRGLSVKRQRDGLSLLTRLLGYAVQAGLIVRNPAYRLDGARDYMPKQGQGASDGAKHVLTARQLRRLADAEAVDGFGDVILFAATTGLRWQEWACLTVGDVDAEARTVSVSKALTKMEDATFHGRKGYALGPPKTKAERTVPILPEVMEAITPRLRGEGGERDGEAILFTTKGKPIVYGSFAAKLKAGAAEVGGRVAEVQTALGRKPSGTASEELLQAAQAAGIDTGDLIPGDSDFTAPTPHGLRHSAITALINSGVPVTAVSRWAGHGSPLVTLSVYSHLYADSLEDAATSLSNWLGSKSAG